MKLQLKCPNTFWGYFIINKHILLQLDNTISKDKQCKNIVKNLQNALRPKEGLAQIKNDQSGLMIYTMINNATKEEERKQEERGSI